MSYNSDKGLLLLKSCMRKIRSNCIKTRFIRFKTHYGVNKIEFYSNTKDKTAVLINLFVVYIFLCPGCGANYTDKTERTLYERTVTALVFNICLILRLCIRHFLRHQHLFKADKFDLRTTRINLVQDSTEIIDRRKNWNILLFKEALKIKELKPTFNSGLKESKELQLF